MVLIRFLQGSVNSCENSHDMHKESEAGAVFVTIFARVDSLNEHSVRECRRHSALSPITGSKSECGWHAESDRARGDAI